MSQPPPVESAAPERKGPIIQSSGLDYRELALRISLVVLNLGSVAFFWWSLTKVLMPLQKQTQDTNLIVTRLISEVDRMERVLAEGDVEQVRGKYGDVRSWLFVGRPAVEAWLGGLKEQVVPLALDVEFDFTADPAPATATTTTTNAPLTINPTRVTLKVRPAPGIEAVASPFQRTLQLTQRLTEQEKRVDLVELTATGGSNSVENVTVVLNLWTGEESDLQ